MKHNKDPLEELYQEVFEDALEYMKEGEELTVRYTFYKV